MPPTPPPLPSLQEMNEALQKRARLVLDHRNKGRPPANRDLSMLDGVVTRYRCVVWGVHIAWSEQLLGTRDTAMLYRVWEPFLEFECMAWNGTFAP